MSRRPARVMGEFVPGDARERRTVGRKWVRKRHSITVGAALEHEAAWRDAAQFVDALLPESDKERPRRHMTEPCGRFSIIDIGGIWRDPRSLNDNGRGLALRPCDR